ncbi:MAG: hypothetical protein HY816_17840 [Candidatus Wallbacteria bacterium]|nr:hypothetical protein [Candidatus Wallbacteria bacterium]
MSVVELLVRASIRAGVDSRRSGPLLGEVARLPAVWRMEPGVLEGELTAMRRRMLVSALRDARPAGRPVLGAVLTREQGLEVLRSVARILIRSSPEVRFARELELACAELGLPGTEVSRALDDLRSELASWER